MNVTERPLTMLGMSWRNLYRQPLRTVLTALGVSLGVIAIVAFGTMVRGFWASTNAAIHYSEGDMMIFQAGAAADIFSSLDEASTRAMLLADPDVVAAVPTLMHVMPAPRLRFGLTIGMHPQDMAERDRQLLRGRIPQDANEVIIGVTAARQLGKDVGDELILARHSLRVVGVFETEVVYFNSAVVMPLRRLQELIQRPGQVTSFQVRVRAGINPDLVAHRLEQAHKNLLAITSAAQYQKVDQGLEIANGLVSGVSFMAIVIGSVIVTNTMWMSVHERTREIGVLRAVGWGRRRIITSIVIEAFGVGLLACVMGCLLGTLLAKLTTMLPVTAQFVDPVYDWQPYTIALTVAIALSVVGSILPAWRAARISPVEALRYE